MLILHGFVHKSGFLECAFWLEKDIFGVIFDYFDKIRTFFGHFGLSKLFTAERVIFALMTIAKKIMMVISPFLMVSGVIESFKILPAEVTKPNIAFKNSKEIVGCFT